MSDQGRHPHRQLHQIVRSAALTALQLLDPRENGDLDSLGLFELLVHTALQVEKAQAALAEKYEAEDLQHG